MKLFSLFSVALLCAASSAVLTAGPASAITAELAKKCRQLAFEAHPPVRAGTKAGTGAESRAFYKACIDNGGNPPASDSKAPSATTPAEKSGAAPRPPAKPQ